MIIYSKAIAILFILFLTTAGMHANVAEGSNLGWSGYPRFSAYAPPKPYSTDDSDTQQYKQGIENYVREAREYIDNANRDIENIQQIQRETINQVEREIDGYYNWIRNYRQDKAGEVGSEVQGYFNQIRGY